MDLRRCQPSRRGIFLIDLMFYISLLALVLILVGVVFDQMLRQTSRLRRNISDIERTMLAGERWRADVRKATAELAVDGETAVIPQAAGNVTYQFGNVVKRRAPNSENWDIILAGVKESKMVAERRAFASGWRWEIELESQRTARMRPLFTFMATTNAN